MARFLDKLRRMSVTIPGGPSGPSGWVGARGLVILGLAGLLAGCDGEIEPEPAPDHELLTQVQAAKYRTWPRPSGREMRKGSAGPHGFAVDVFINEVVVEAAANKDGLGRMAWPEDATIVVEGFAAPMDEAPTQIAVMQKRHGSWYWEQYQAEDLERPRFAGRPDVCVGCHGGGQDFVRSFALPKPVAKK